RGRTSPARRRRAERRCWWAVRAARGRSSASRDRIPGRSAHRSPWWIDSLSYEGQRERWDSGRGWRWSSGGCAPVVPGGVLDTCRVPCGKGCAVGCPGPLGGPGLGGPGVVGVLGLGQADAAPEGGHEVGVVAGDLLGLVARHGAVTELGCDVLLGAAAGQLGP